MDTLSLKKRFELSRFLNGEKPVDQPIILNQRRVFILPTYRGLNFALLTSLLLLIAFVYNNNLVYMLAFLLASIFFITILHTYKSLAGLVVQKGQCKPVFAGEPAGFVIHIDNPINVERFYLQVTLEETQSVAIAPFSKTQVLLYSATQKRGWHSAGKVTLASTYPLGLFRAWSPLRFDFNVLVYPKPSIHGLAFPETPSDQGARGVNAKGADDFYGLKSYQAGDAINHIYWKAFAKGQGLFSKQYDGEASTQIWLNYDNAPGNHIEERLSQLCRWVLEAERADLAFGFTLPSLTLPPDRGAAHTKKCLAALALF